MSRAAVRPRPRAWWWILAVVGALAVLRGLVSDWRLAASYDVGPVGDIGIYLEGVRRMNLGQALYGWTDASGYGFTYPPFAALLFKPLVWASPHTTGQIWTAATMVVAVILGAVVVLTRRPALPRVLAFAAVCFAVAVFLQSIQVQANLVTGQINLFLALLLVLDLGGLVPRRMRGVLVGIAAAIKLTPLVVVPWYVVTRRWADLARSLVTFAVAAVIGFVVLPDDSRDFWGTVIHETDRVGDASLASNASVFGVLSRAGVEGTLLTVSWVLVGGALVLAAYFWARRLWQAGDAVPAAVVLGCAAIVASPISWPHHQIWLPLAGIVLVGRWRPVPAVAGLAIIVWSDFHTVITQHLEDAGHALGLLRSTDFALFAAICLLGLGRAGTPSRSPGPTTARH